MKKLSLKFTCFFLGLLISLVTVNYSFSSDEVTACFSYTISEPSHGTVYYYGNTATFTVKTYGAKHNITKGYLLLYSAPGCAVYWNGFTRIWPDSDPSVTTWPPPAEPSYCTNGIRDYDPVTFEFLEDGIDCGYDCASPDDVCSTFCPIGFISGQWLSTDGNTINGCLSDNGSNASTVPILGKCPVNSVFNVGDTTLCRQTDVFTYASSDYDPEDITEPQVDTNPWNEVETTEVTEILYDSTVEPDGTVVDTVIEEVTYNSEDGTQSTDLTTEVTATATDGSKTVTITSTSSSVNSSGDVISNTSTRVDTYNSNGDLTGSSITGTSAKSDDDVGDDFASAGGVGQEGLDAVTRGDGTSIDFSPISGAVSGLMTRFPFSVITRVEGFFDSWIVEPQAPSFDISFPAIQSEPFQMNLDLIEPLAVFFRALMGFGALITGAYVIIRTWRG